MAALRLESVLVWGATDLVEDSDGPAADAEEEEAPEAFDEALEAAGLLLGEGAGADCSVGTAGFAGTERDDELEATCDSDTDDMFRDCVRSVVTDTDMLGLAMGFAGSGDSSSFEGLLEAERPVKVTRELANTVTEVETGALLACDTVVKLRADDENVEMSLLLMAHLRGANCEP